MKAHRTDKKVLKSRENIYNETRCRRSPMNPEMQCVPTCMMLASMREKAVGDPKIGHRYSLQN